MQKHILYIVIVLGTILISCNRSTDPINSYTHPQDYQLSINDLRSNFSDSINGGSVNLKWTPPDTSKFDFYRIFRTTSITLDSAVDTTTFISTERRLYVKKDKNTFLDILDCANTKYYYRISAGKIDPITHDTTICAPSNIDSTFVGSDVSFNINYGDMFTATDQCTLVVNDPAWRTGTGIIDSVVFSQYTRSFLVRQAGTSRESVQVAFDDPNNPPSEDFLKGLITAGWILTSGKLQSGVNKILVPDFTTKDIFNSRTSLRIRQPVSRLSWRLLQGNGDKTVYAKICKIDGTVDTVPDNIGIQPYRMKVQYRSELLNGKPTMRQASTMWEGTGKVVPSVHFFKPKILFNIITFSDSTFNLDFDCWLMTHTVNQGSGDLSVESSDLGGLGLYETKPKKMLLTGYGALHNEKALYTYYFDSTSSEGQDNIRTLRKTFRSPVVGSDANILAFKLMGSEAYNEASVPGSYFGSNGIYWDNITGSYKKGYKYLSATPSENFNNICYLNTANKNLGRKEVVLVIRTKGRFFGDVRTLFSRFIEGKSYKGPLLQNRSGIDFYPPRISMRSATDQTGVELSDGFLSVRLAKGTSVVDNEIFTNGDGDNVKISEVTLVVAKRVNQSIAPAAMSINDILSMRHMEFPYKIDFPKPVLTQVAWERIDVRNWQSGEYLFAVITSDEYGNRGLAFSVTPANTNPFVNTIATGK